MLLQISASLMRSATSIRSSRTGRSGGFPGRASEPNGITRTIRWFCRKGRQATTTCLIMPTIIATALMHEPPAGWCWFDLMLSASWFFSATRGADHPRDFRRYQIIYDPCIICRRRCASRCIAQRRAVQGLASPPALAQVRAKLKQHADGDQQFVKVLGAVLAHGLSAVEAACAEALAAGIASGDVILTVLRAGTNPRRRLRSPRRMACA